MEDAPSPKIKRIRVAGLIILVWQALHGWGLAKSGCAFVAKKAPAVAPDVVLEIFGTDTGPALKSPRVPDRWKREFDALDIKIVPYNKSKP